MLFFYSANNKQNSRFYCPRFEPAHWTSLGIWKLIKHNIQPLCSGMQVNNCNFASWSKNNNFLFCKTVTLEVYG